MNFGVGYETRTARSKVLFNEASYVIPGGAGSSARTVKFGWKPYPPFIAQGTGSHVRDVDGHDYVDLPVLLKAKGKCTTDQISAAGPWLRYRGHLENISGNLFLGVTNAFTDATGEGKDPSDGQTRSFADIARRLSLSGIPWCAVGAENYGEGSSREHAAMEPRYRGGLVILARSFARIHETNLKKQGILPLTFADPTTYERIGEDDRISVLGLASLAPDTPVHCRTTRPDGTHLDFGCTHTFSRDQLEWFHAGSALNVIRRRQPGRPTAT